MNKAITKHHIVLGIAPGTIDNGLAVFQSGGLIDYQVKTFREKYSPSKMKRILNFIKETIELHEVNAIAVKIPKSDKRQSKKVLQLISSIEKMAKAKHILVIKSDLSFLKEKCESGSRKELSKYLIQKYPELTFMDNDKLNKDTYYGKMVEAIAAGMQLVEKCS
ncbi:MAG TPA: hypothetical protein VK808_12245 [Bacteroidia bacterium]|jgi:hypothetical protein|nr:hypothetical protein [Bacteroidia bacterium]